MCGGMRFHFRQVCQFQLLFVGEKTIKGEKVKYKKVYVKAEFFRLWSSRQEMKTNDIPLDLDFPPS